MTSEPVTALYVPGDRPDRFDKAARSGADFIILDLEDAVAPRHKDKALSNVVAWLAGWHPGRGYGVEVRVNGRHELLALEGVHPAVGLRVPKVEHADDLDGFGGRSLTALIESALGVENAGSIAAHSSVVRVALGESDLASDLGSRSPVLRDYARSRLLFAARAAGKPAPMLAAFPGVGDPDGLRADTEQGRDLGWYGRTAIHPSQLAVIEAVFVPTVAEIAWAREVVALTADGGVATLENGEMVDSAMVGRAQRLLERSTRVQPPSREAGSEEEF